MKSDITRTRRLHPGISAPENQSGLDHSTSISSCAGEGKHCGLVLFPPSSSPTICQLHVFCLPRICIYWIRATEFMNKSSIEMSLNGSLVRSSFGQCLLFRQQSVSCTDYGVHVNWMPHLMHAPQTRRAAGLNRQKKSTPTSIVAVTQPNGQCR